MINIPPNSCKNILLAVLTGSIMNSFTASTQLHMCIYAHIIDKGTLVGQRNEQIWDSTEYRVPFGACVPKVRQPWSRSVFLNRGAADRYRALTSIIPGRERSEVTTICYKISLVQLITNLNVILHLSTYHTVYIGVLILFMIMP
jgi:hypothetical protein